MGSWTERPNRRTDEQANGWTDRQAERWMGGLKGQADRQMNGWVFGQTDRGKNFILSQLIINCHVLRFKMFFAVKRKYINHPTL